MLKKDKNYPVYPAAVTTVAAANDDERAKDERVDVQIGEALFIYNSFTKNILHVTLCLALLLR